MLLLADIFETFRKFSQDNYRLDPAHYVSSPQLSWDAMLLHTDSELELIADPQMFEMIDNGIRGGVAMIVKRYARANNPQLGAEFNPNLPTSFIIYLDANNLYGWAMSQYMPFRGFHWLKVEEWENIDWTLQRDEQPNGYFIECDLLYDKSFHDLHNDYPLAPERMQMNYERLNDTQLKILRNYRISKSSLQITKLVPHLLTRKNYCVHYLNLKFYLEHGMSLEKVHRVIAFEQKPWLKPYIDKNQALRTAATNDFEKDQAKLYNNSIYGKTVENQKKRTDIRLVNNERHCKMLIKKPHMIRFKIFDENLAAIELRKTKAQINKPFYVGFSVLELSKLLMYRFHYDYIKHQFNEKAELLFTDTDSLMYQIFDENVYETFYKVREKYFDFCEFPKNSPFFDDHNKRKIGFFKDEAKGQLILEFVGLRPKMYSYLIHSEKGVEEKHRAKGIQSAVAKNFRHENYLKELKTPLENFVKNRRIGSKLHNLYSIETKKRGLCAFDDKRILLDEEITTLAYGHYKVTGEVKELISDEPLLQSVQETRPFPDFEEEFPTGQDPQKLALAYLLEIYEENQAIDYLQEEDEDDFFN